MNSHNNFWAGERRLIYGLGSLSYETDGCNMIIKILTPPQEPGSKKAKLINQVMNTLFRKILDADFSTSWSWEPSEIYINILIEFDDEIRDPSAFALSQLGLIRWEWSLANAKDYLMFYLAHVCNYPPESALERVAELFSKQTVDHLRGYDWIDLLPDAANASRYHTMTIVAADFGNAELHQNLPKPCATFPLSFWDFKMPPES